MYNIKSQILKKWEKYNHSSDVIDNSHFVEGILEWFENLPVKEGWLESFGTPPQFKNVNFNAISQKMIEGDKEGISNIGVCLNEIDFENELVVLILMDSTNGGFVITNESIYFALAPEHGIFDSPRFKCYKQKLTNIKEIIYSGPSRFLGSWHTIAINGRIERELVYLGTEGMTDMNASIAEVLRIFHDKRGKPQHGQGTYTYPGLVAKYVGEWKDSKMHGQGTLTYADGGKYIGEWKDDKANGKGRRAFDNGDKYVGEWKNGEQHGKGTYTWADGSKYVGEWKDSKEHGKGTYTWADGSKYVGEWKNGEQHGQGIETDADGDKYIGEWKEAAFNGKGTFIAASGKTREGEWKNGEPIGVFKVTEPDGSTTTIDSGDDGELKKLATALLSKHALNVAVKFVVDRFE